MFDTVLVADRGMLACRVVATCQRLGARAVTIHSAADTHRLHTVCADESLLLGPADPASTYLDGLKVIEAAGQAGAQAVHPGAGALARSAAFASAVLQAGLTWVGPPPEVLAAADRAAATPGDAVAVTVLAHVDGTVLALAETRRAAGRASCPAAGGADARRRARSAATGAAAAAGLLGLASVTVTAAGDVCGVRPWLSADHAVVELVTGVDLVEQQLLVAAGKPPSVTGDGAPGVAAVMLGLRAGAAGRLGRLVLPQGDGLRVEAGCREGEDVSPADGVLLTLAARGATATEADERLAAARAQLVAEGIDLEEDL